MADSIQEVLNPADGTLKSTTLFVRVRGPENLFYEGEARAVSSVNDRGPFDVLPTHENFITIIKKYITLHLQNKQRKDIELEHGILKVVGNSVYIFLGIETVEKIPTVSTIAPSNNSNPIAK